MHKDFNEILKKVVKGLDRCRDKKCWDCPYLHETSIGCRNNLIEDAYFVVRYIVLEDRWKKGEQ